MCGEQWLINNDSWAYRLSASMIPFDHQIDVLPVLKGFDVAHQGVQKSSVGRTRSVELDDLSGSFTVVQPTPTPSPEPTQTPEPSPTPSPTPEPTPEPGGIPGFPIESIILGLLLVILVQWLYHSK